MMFGWKIAKYTNVALWTMVNVPVGNYDKGELANLSYHHWAVDNALALTWRRRNPETKRGWDLSTKIGVARNGTNKATDYKTGNEFHVEGAIERLFSRTWSAGPIAYHYAQLSGDSGSGASLGPLKGRASRGQERQASHTVFLTIKPYGEVPFELRFKCLEEVEGHAPARGAVVLLLSDDALVGQGTRQRYSRDAVTGRIG